MKKKYIYERFPQWFNHGGTIIAANSKREVWLDSELPQPAIEEHNMTVEFLADMALAWSKSDDEAFKKFYYEHALTQDQ